MTTRAFLFAGVCAYALAGLGCGASAPAGGAPDAGPRYTLTVDTVAGGRVVSTPAGIDCGATCSAEFALGTTVSLQAQPDADHLFLGWSNACEGSRPCNLVMNEALRARPIFDPRYQCSADGWCQIHPFPSRDNLWLLELTDDTHALTGGRELLYGDGVSWSSVSKPFAGGLNDSAVRSRAPLDLWLIPDDGTVHRWDGTQFTSLATGGSTRALWGAWFATPDDGWVVGDTGTILRWNGTALAPFESGTTTILYSVWGAAPNRVWIPGRQGLILYYDGVKIAPQASGTAEDLNDIFGTTASNMWVVGNSGVILHWDGSAWKAVASDTTDNIIACTGDPATGEMWAVGDRGTLLYYDRTSWKRQQSGVASGLRQVRVSARQIWAIGFGGVVLRKQR